MTASDVTDSEFPEALPPASVVSVFCRRCGALKADELAVCGCESVPPPLPRLEIPGQPTLKAAVALYFTMLAVSMCVLIHAMVTKKDSGARGDIIISLIFAAATIPWAFRYAKIAAADASADRLASLVSYRSTGSNFLVPSRYDQHRPHGAVDFDQGNRLRRPLSCRTLFIRVAAAQHVYRPPPCLKKSRSEASFLTACAGTSHRPKPSWSLR